MAKQLASRFLHSDVSSENIMILTPLTGKSPVSIKPKIFVNPDIDDGERHRCQCIDAQRK